MKKIRLISYVGVRDKHFLDYHNNGIKFEEAIELSSLSGGVENYEKCKWINRIIVPENFNDVLTTIKKNYCDITLVYLGRKNINLVNLKNILLISKQSGSTTIVINDKKFIRVDSISTAFKMIVKELLSLLLSKMNYIKKDNLIDYFIFNSRSANLDIFKKFKTVFNFKSSFFDFSFNNSKSKRTNYKKRSGIYLDSYIPFQPQVKKNHGSSPPPKEYYERITTFLYEQRKIRNLDEIYIFLHPNSESLEKDFFKDFKILDRSKYKLEDLDFCKLCWSPGSDAMITLTQLGVKSIVVTNSNLPKSLYEYHLQKSKMLNVDCISLLPNGEKAYINRSKERSIINKIFFLQFDNAKESAVVIVKKLINNC